MERANTSLNCECLDESMSTKVVMATEQWEISEPSLLRISDWCACSYKNIRLPRSFHMVSRVKETYEPLVLLDNITWGEVSVRHTLGLEIYDNIQNLKADFAKIENVSTVHDLIKYGYIKEVVTHSISVFQGVLIILALAIGGWAAHKWCQSSRRSIHKVSAERKGNVLHIRTTQPLFENVK